MQKEKPGKDSFAELRDDTVNERIQEILAKLVELDQGIQESKARLTQINQEIQSDSRLGAETKALIEQYMDAVNFEIGVQFKHLYKQGAEDCVRLLRELGVIK